MIPIPTDTGNGVPVDKKMRIVIAGYGKILVIGYFPAMEIPALAGMTIRETGLPGFGVRFEIHIPNGTCQISHEAGERTFRPLPTLG